MDNNTLITYGSLMPGKSNHHIVSAIPGEWIYGTIKGHMVNADWEMYGGYPAVSFNPLVVQHLIRVAILISMDLEMWWNRLDEFEGDEYLRVRSLYTTHDGSQGSGWIYVSVPDVDK